MKKLSLLLCSLILSMTSVVAQNFEPTKRNIEIVVPYPAGGATDKLARVVDQILNQAGWRSHVTNRAGADGVIGGNYAARSRPDGHTIFMSGTGLLDANIAFRAAGIEYNERSFVPVVPVANVSYVLVVKKGMPIDSYERFKFYVRTNPDRFNVAFWNANTANVFREWARAEGLPPPNIILYKGSAPMMVDVLGGHVDFAWDTWVSAAPHFAQDRIKIIATLDNQGHQVIKKIRPDSEVVSVARTHPSLAVGVWYGVWAPAGTPKEVIQKINSVINQGLKQPQAQQALESMNIIRSGGSADQLGQLQSLNFRVLQRLAQ